MDEFDLRGTTYWKFVGAWCFAVIVLVSWGQAAAKKHRLKLQREDEVWAESLNSPFTLFLRPFATEGEIGIPSQSRPFSFLSIFEENEAIEQQLARAIGDLRVVGGLESTVGQVRVLSSDDDWKEKFARLAKAAARIFVLPLLGPGTLWEIEWLKENGLLSKTIFIMPMSLTFTDYGATWEASKAELAANGISVPHYKRGGMTFMIREDGSTVEFDVKDFNVHAIRDVVRKVYRPEQSTGPVSAAIRALVGAFVMSMAVLLSLSALVYLEKPYVIVISPFFLSFGIFFAANFLAGSNFSRLQMVGAGAIWFILYLLWGLLGARYGLSGHLGSLTAPDPLLAFTIRARVLVNSLCFAGDISLTIAVFTFRSVSTVSKRAIKGVPLAWFGASIVVSIPLLFLGAEPHYFEEILGLAAAALIGSWMWMRVLLRSPVFTVSANGTDLRL